MKKRTPSELTQPVWALISFEKIIERDLTYEQAARLRDGQPKVTNELVVVTNDAADRMHGPSVLITDHRPLTTVPV